MSDHKKPCDPPKPVDPSEDPEPDIDGGEPAPPIRH